ncbi:hypothetical protein L1987_18601 [Smallanthus sonchifolius]|uniref:Uncharacterized protein n=1 Tax=Smallanthus sonchifolius TaxID=185202 RepID=A0ACB9J288_9ASTR|nr:hypothetical protein L1987_18601 [Smallanthus sonchifolius]
MPPIRMATCNAGNNSSYDTPLETLVANAVNSTILGLIPNLITQIQQMQQNNNGENNSGGNNNDGNNNSDNNNDGNNNEGNKNGENNTDDTPPVRSASSFSATAPPSVADLLLYIRPGLNTDLRFATQPSSHIRVPSQLSRFLICFVQLFRKYTDYLLLVFLFRAYFNF